MPVAGGAPAVLTPRSTKTRTIVAWKPNGHLVRRAARRRYSYLYRLDPDTKAIAKTRAGRHAANGELRVLAVERRTGDRVPAMPTRSRWRRFMSEAVGARQEDHRHERADRELDDQHARGRLVEEPGRRHDRRGPAQAGRLRSGAEVPAARRHPRRTDRRVARRPVHELDLSDRRLGAARRARARAELSRQRRLRREVPGAERPQPRHRRCVGRCVGRRFADRQGHGRSSARRHDGLEPGRLHLGVPRHARCGALQGDFGRRRHLRLDDLLRQHRHPSVHAPVPESDAVGRSRNLREDVADHLHQAGEDADADSARRRRSARAAAQRVRAVSGARRTTTCRRN